MQSVLNGKYASALATDRETSLATFKPFGSNPIFIVLEGEPRSKARPRVGGSRKSYDDGKQVRHADQLRLLMDRSIPAPMAGNVAIACTFYRSSLRRIDVDNLLKQVLDAATGILWRDDMQVTACIGILKLDPDLPRTAIVFGRHNEPSLDRSNQDLAAVCRNCGTPFSWRKYPKSRRVGAFCSVACKNKFGRSDLTEPVACRECGGEFKRRTASQVMCSESCRRSEMARRNARSPS